MKKHFWLLASALSMLLAGCSAQEAKPVDAVPAAEASTTAATEPGTTAANRTTTVTTSATTTETTGTDPAETTETVAATEPPKRKISPETAGAVEVYETVRLKDYITAPDIRLKNGSDWLDTSRTRSRIGQPGLFVVVIRKTHAFVQIKGFSGLDHRTVSAVEQQRRGGILDLVPELQCPGGKAR